MSIFRKLSLSASRRARQQTGVAGLSRRDALMASLGSMIPLPAAAARPLAIPSASLGAGAPPPANKAPTQIYVNRPDAPARTIQSKSLDVYSVNDKGAIGDGKTDNTNAINAAILEAHSTGGGEIIFGASASTYRVKGPILLPSNIVLNLNGQTLAGDGFNGGTMFSTAMVKNGRLVSNDEASNESEFVFYSSIRNGVIRNCAIAFDFLHFNVSCTIENVSTFEVLQFGIFENCFYMAISNCSARGPSDPEKPAFSFIRNNNLISLFRVSVTMDSGFLFDGGTTSVSMIACSCEGGKGSAIAFRGDCLGVVVDSGYWEAIQGTVFDFSRAKVCSVSFRSNFVNYCDTIIDDGGVWSGSTLFGSFDETNYFTNIGVKYGDFVYRGRMIVNCPRNFIRFDIPFSNDDSGVLPSNWIVGASTRIEKETARTGRSLADVRSRSRIYYQGPIPIVREGDVGDPLPGSIDRTTVAIPKGSAVTADVDTRIVWRPNSLRATFILSVADDSGAFKLFGDIYGDQLVQQDRNARHALVENHGGFLRLRLSGVDNRSGRASVTGSLQLCT
jgi:hypothetical protein